MSKGITLALSLLFVPALLAPFARSSQDAPARSKPGAVPAAAPAAAPLAAQDRSWYPYDVAPPFVADDFEDDSVDAIYAGSAVLTVDGTPTLPPALEKPLYRAGAFLPGYFLVHFEESVRLEDKQLLDAISGPVTRADGSDLARWYVPNNTLIAYLADPSQLAFLDAHPRVDLVARYQPAYKLDPRIGTFALQSPERKHRAFYRLNLDLVPGHPAADVAAQATALGATVLETIELRGASVYDVRFVVVDASPSTVTRLATIEGVRTIQETGDGVAFHDLSGGGKLQNRTLSVDDGPNSPIVTNAAFPLWLTHNLQGQGQLIGVVDSSLDWNNTGTSGCNFGYPDTAISNYGFADPVTFVAAPANIGRVGRRQPEGAARRRCSAARRCSAGPRTSTAAPWPAPPRPTSTATTPTSGGSTTSTTGSPGRPSNFSGLLGPGIAHEAQIYFTPVDGLERTTSAGSSSASSRPT